MYNAEVTSISSVREAFTQSDENGRFTIPNVPLSSYRLGVVYPRLKWWLQAGV